jgi:DNA-binding phage protein
MLCGDLRTFIETTLPEERSPEQLAAAHEHAGQCPGCAEYLAEMLALEKRLSALPPVAAPASVKRAVMARVLSASGKPSEAAKEPRFAVAGSAVLVAALVLSCVPYWIALRAGQWGERSWTLRQQLVEQLGVSGFNQPWTMAAPCAVAACLVAGLLFWRDSRA